MNEYSKNSLSNPSEGAEKPLYRSLSSWFRERCGETLRKVPLDNGATCPNRDGTLSTGGCLFCSVPSFSPLVSSEQTDRSRAFPKKPEDLVMEFQNMAEKMNRGGRVKKFLPYLNAFTPTNLPPDQVIAQLEALAGHPLSAGISLCTRPDSIDPLIMEYLAERASAGTLVMVELGLQSSDDRLMGDLGRGHGSESFFLAAQALSQAGVETCAHLIFGLPGQSHEEMIRSAIDATGSRGCGGVKFHNFHICRHTRMEQLYQNRPWPLISQQDYVRAVVESLERIAPERVVHRLCATVDQQFLAAPGWASDPGGIRGSITGELNRKGSFQGRFYSQSSPITSRDMS